VLLDTPANACGGLSKALSRLLVIAGIETHHLAVNFFLSRANSDQSDAEFVGWAKSPAMLVNSGLGACAILPTLARAISMAQTSDETGIEIRLAIFSAKALKS
jgi:hypothetical protein